MMSTTSAVMIGLASAGKTTFLAALYHVVESATVPGSLRLSRMPPVREHLERIRKEWLAVQPQTRTTASVLDQNVIELKSAADEPIGSIYFPDLAGETLSVLVEERTCSSEFANVFGSVDRILLFIHPDKVIDSPTMHEVEELRRHIDEAIEADVENERSVELIPSPNQVPWDVSTVSSQVKLVELLQIVGDMSFGLKKVGIIISAWDRVKSQSLSPQKWLEKRLPLLWQYLCSGSDKIDVAFFGVSAVGGDPETDKEDLESKLSPAERIEVIGADDGFHISDITRPVRWLLSN